MRDDRMEELYFEHRGTRYAASARREYVAEMRHVSPQHEADQCPDPDGTLEGYHVPPQPRALELPPVRQVGNGYPQRTGVDTMGEGR